MPRQPHAIMTRLLDWWRQADPAPPAFLPSYPAREQARREAHLDRYLEAVEAELRAAPRNWPEQARSARLSRRITTLRAEGVCTHRVDGSRSSN